MENQRERQARVEGRRETRQSTHETWLTEAGRLSDAELLRRVVTLAGRERASTVDLVAHLAVLDTRRLYRGEGYGSLFGYCTGALRLSEHAACARIEAARASRAFRGSWTCSPKAR